MPSDDFNALEARVKKLKKRFFPPLKNPPRYTPAQQDFMRALRMLVHAEIEHYLEAICKRLAGDLKKEAAGYGANFPVKQWADRAVKLALDAASANNGVKDSDIRKMFDPLGFSDDDYNQVSDSFLDKMKIFGMRRGDVAHKSSMRVTFNITRQNDEKAIDELINYLRDFDGIVANRRLFGFGMTVLKLSEYQQRRF